MAKCPEIHASGEISPKRVQNRLIDALLEMMKAVSARSSPQAHPPQRLEFTVCLAGDGRG